MTDVPYTELAPPRDLCAYVDRFWVKRMRAPRDRSQRVLPDGCVDLLVDVGAERSELVGPMTRAHLFPAGASHVVAVRFKPGAGSRFAGVPLDALADAHAPVSEVGLIESEIVDNVCGAGDLGACVRALEGLVRRRLETADAPDRLARRAVLE
ncbi:MAG: hypothetical protein K8H88_01440, partial [Sandaracinaceae bacterium]|nr:hypothetical protein [Sandaracinaceae bacterium]